MLYFNLTVILILATILCYSSFWLFSVAILKRIENRLKEKREIIFSSIDSNLMNYNIDIEKVKIYTDEFEIFVYPGTSNIKHKKHLINLFLENTDRCIWYLRVPLSRFEKWIIKINKGKGGNCWSEFGYRP